MRCVNMLSRLWHAPDGDGARLLDDRLERGRDARRARAEAPLAEAARGRRQADRQAEPRHGHQRPGLLGEVRQLLGRRDAARADGGRPLPPLAPRRPSRGATRTRSASSRSSARPSTAPTSRSRRSAPRSTTCRHGPASTCRSTSTARPAPSSRRSSTRTWSGTSGCRASPRSTPPGHKYGLVYPGVGWVLWRDAAALPDDLDLLGQLPRRQHADLRAQLLASRRAGRGAVLQLPPARLRRLPARPGVRARRRDAACRPRSRSSGRSG